MALGDLVPDSDLPPGLVQAAPVAPTKLGAVVPANDLPASAPALDWSKAKALDWSKAKVVPDKGVAQRSLLGGAATKSVIPKAASPLPPPPTINVTGIGTVHFGGMSPDGRPIYVFPDGSKHYLNLTK